MPCGTTDPTPGNNTVTDTDTLTPQADLEVTKVNAGTTVVAGASTGYTIEVTNNGPSVVTGATVTDVMPGGIDVGHMDVFGDRRLDVPGVRQR